MLTHERFAVLLRKLTCDAERGYAFVNHLSSQRHLPFALGLGKVLRASLFVNS